MNSTPGKTINFTPYSEAAMMTVPTLISNVGQRINRSSNFKKVDTLGSQCEIPIDQKVYKTGHYEEMSARRIG
jgi:hypothetical protein